MRNFFLFPVSLPVWHYLQAGFPGRRTTSLVILISSVTFIAHKTHYVKPEKEITIYDIAKQLNISPSTVSRALNDNASVSASTKKKVNALAENLGYRHNLFASSLRLQKTHTIGVILHELNSYFITSVLAGIEKIATEAKYNLIIVHSAENANIEVANAHNLFHKRVDGVIASLSFNTENLSHFKQFQSKNIPVVFFDRVFENSDGAKIIINNFQAGYDATSHLIEQGCRHIAHITSSLKRNVYAERLRGYKQALQDHKLKFDEKLLIIDGLKEEDAARSANRILGYEELCPMAFLLPMIFVQPWLCRRLRMPAYAYLRTLLLLVLIMTVSVKW